jgi:hypothetical protein
VKTDGYGPHGAETRTGPDLFCRPFEIPGDLRSDEKDDEQDDQRRQSPCHRQDRVHLIVLEVFDLADRTTP